MIEIVDSSDDEQTPRISRPTAPSRRRLSATPKSKSNSKSRSPTKPPASARPRPPPNSEPLFLPDTSPTERAPSFGLPLAPHTQPEPSEGSWTSPAIIVPRSTLLNPYKPPAQPVQDEQKGVTPSLLTKKKARMKSPDVKEEGSWLDPQPMTIRVRGASSTEAGPSTKRPVSPPTPSREQPRSRRRHAAASQTKSSPALTTAVMVAEATAAPADDQSYREPRSAPASTSLIEPPTETDGMIPPPSAWLSESEDARLSISNGPEFPNAHFAFEDTLSPSSTTLISASIRANEIDALTLMDIEDTLIDISTKTSPGAVEAALESVREVVGDIDIAGPARAPSLAPSLVDIKSTTLFPPDAIIPPYKAHFEFLEGETLADAIRRRVDERLRQKSTSLRGSPLSPLETSAVPALTPSPPPPRSPSPPPRVRMSHARWREIVEEEGEDSDLDIIEIEPTGERSLSSAVEGIDFTITGVYPIDIIDPPPPPERRSAARRKFDTTAIDRWNLRAKYLTPNPALHCQIFTAWIGDAIAADEPGRSRDQRSQLCRSGPRPTRHGVRIQ